jgi:pimeloyl-ACP methyl ester carboxylesterase
MHGYQYEWENEFTVVNWDQRQAGKTYIINDPDAVLETMSIERVLADAHEVTQYVRQKLNVDRIIILAHSWGTVLGTMLVQAYPEDYSAYIGVGQIVNVNEGELAIHEKILEMAQMAGNTSDIAALEALAPYPPHEKTPNNAVTNDPGMMSGLAPYLNKYKLPSGIGIPLLMVKTGITTPYYKTGEILQFMSEKSINYYNDPLYRFVYEDFDATNYGTDYRIPVYYIMGENDWQTPYPVAKDFFNAISAPDKAFYSIPDAGHWTMIDNKTEFNRILLNEIKPKSN